MAKALNILLIEDNPGDALLLEESLALLNVKIVCASSLAEAADCVSRCSFDAVLLDLNLPDSNGLETISRASEKLHDLPIIVLTGMEDEDGAMKAISFGAQDYLVKGQTDERSIFRTIRYAIDRKRAQETIRRERDFVSTILDTAGSLVVVLDRDGRIVRFNRACEEATGYSFSEAKGRRVWDFLLLPEEIETVKDTFNSLLSGEFFKEAENRWLTKDGNERLIAWTNSILRNGNAIPTSVVSAGIDITERRNAERMLSDYMKNLEQLTASATRLLESMPYHDIFCFTAKQLEKIAGQALISVSEYKAHENKVVLQALVGPEHKLRALAGILGRDPVGLAFPYHEEIKDRLVKGKLAELGDGVPVLTFGQFPESLCRRVEEGLSLGRAFAMPFQLEDDFLGMIAVLTDRGEGLRNQGMIEAFVNQAGLALKRKRAEEALERAKQELEERVIERTYDLSRAIDSLQMEVEGRILAEEALRDRSNKLRELASELTLAEQRERRRMAKVLHDDLQQLLVGARFQLSPLQRFDSKAVQEAVRTVNDLLGQSIEISRTLTSELSPPILYEGGLIPALQWLGRWSHEKHGMTMILDFEHYSQSEEPDDIKVLLFEAVRELLLNAVKHSGVRTVFVQVREHKGVLEVMVRDEGNGFDPADLSKKGFTGGHGLFGIRERVESFGGTLVIESHPGDGSCFMVAVPVQAAAPPSRAEEVRVRESPAAFAAVRQPDVHKIRVVLVDDHAVVRQGLTHLLSNEPDIEVVSEAADGEQAIERARELHPDVLLMDINMPRMSGIEATRVLHAELPEVRVIGLSMFEEAERATQMIDAGAVAYVSKSAQSTEVIRAIRTAILQVS